MTEKIILLLCGIPGAGKSTLARRLSESFSGLHCDGLQSVPIVSYDQFQQSKESWNENTFMESRERSLEYLISLLLDQKEGNGEDGPGHDRIVVVDDLMYYRSMRKEIYKIGSLYQAHVVIIYVQTSLEIALRRNRDRPEATRVPDEVVENIWNRFEPPSQSHRWEKHSIAYYTDDASSATSGWDEFFQELCSLVEKAKLDSIEPHVVMSSISPPPSVLQRLDLSLRQVISQVMKTLCSHSSVVDKVHRKKISEILSREKELIFAKAKNGYRLSYHPELSQQQEIGETQSIEWERFINDWKTELIRTLQMGNVSPDEREVFLIGEIQDALADVEWNSH